MESRPAGTWGSQGSGVLIRLIGDLQVIRGDCAVVLPASKRTRALLGYLVAVGAPQSRETLCDLLWDGPDDPRAALRWSLTKLRPMVNEGALVRLHADRERVAFNAHGASVDLSRVAALLDRGAEAAGLAALEEAAALLHGEFLDGLDLPNCTRFHHWCMAERERLGAVRREVVAILIDRLAADPARALPYARLLVAADPLSEAAHATLVRILATLGRGRDATAHAARATEMLRRELAAPLNGELRLAANRLRGDASKPPPPRLPDRDGPAECRPLVGRTAERQAIAAAVAGLLAGTPWRQMLLFVGEPGIGKTRLLEDLAAAAARAGADVISARCYEAETVRPYGCWIDALQGVASATVPEAVRHDLGLVVPSAGSSGDADRVRLLTGVSALVQDLAARRPLVLLLDDLQWIDEASASLLHYLVRTTKSGVQLLFAGAARQGELDDNMWAKRLLQSMTRDGHLERWEIGPLAADEIAALVGPMCAPFGASGGNPLFALELARAAGHATVADSPSIERLVNQRVDRLDERLREVMVWAAAMGRAFRPEILCSVLDIPEPTLLGSIERLERHCLLRSVGDGGFDFAHDLVRQATYRALSHSRRRSIHNRIAGCLRKAVEQDDSLYGDLVHHAGLAGDHVLAVSACVATGERCLRLFANADAVAVADRGLASLQHLGAPTDRIRSQVALLSVKVRAIVGSDLRRAALVADELLKLAEAAEALGLQTEAVSAFHLASWLTQQSNDVAATQAATLRAEKISRTADDVTRCQQIANTGRCLLEVETEVPRALSLVDEAARLASASNLHFVELEWGLALAARWQGDLAEAARHMGEALGLARLREDRWREIECLRWLAMIDLERDDFAGAIEQCQEVLRVVARMGAAAVPAVSALLSLAQRRAGTPGADAALDEHVAALRAFDDKALLAYVLNGCAEVALDCGRVGEARAAATAALAAARAVRRLTEVAVAEALLARTAAADGSTCPQVAGDMEWPSARARLHQLRATLGPPAIPTLVQTTTA